MGFPIIACDCRTGVNFKHPVLDNPNERNEIYQRDGGGGADALFGGAHEPRFRAFRYGHLDYKSNFRRRHKPDCGNPVGCWGFAGQ